MDQLIFASIDAIKMADQERSDSYVVFTMILCALKEAEI